MRFANGQAAILALFLAATGFQAPAIAATFNVSDATTLRSALLTAATNGEDDVIVLAAGTYSTGGTTFTFLTNENNSLTLQGASGTTRSQVVLDGAGTSQVLNVGCVGSCGEIILQGLTVQNGNAGVTGHGGAIGSSRAVTVTNSSFSNNTAIGQFGGAISGDSVNVTNSTFSGNSAVYGGAISGNSVAVTDSTFSNNTAAIAGAIYAGGLTVTVTNSTFSNNMASNGGAIASSSAVTVTNSTFSGNSADDGGAIFGGSVTVTNSTFNGNTSSVKKPCLGTDFFIGEEYGGGAIGGRWFGRPVTVTVTNSTFSNNTSNCLGGAINGSGTITSSIFSNNSAGSSGGAINGSGAITNSLFSGNSAGGNGGATYGGGIIANNTFSGNSAVGSGAAIFVSSTSSIINSLFYGHITPALYATPAYNLYYNLIDTNTGIAGGIPIMVGNVAPGATSPFVDAVNGNFRPAAGSFAIDAGLDPSSTNFANLVGGVTGSGLTSVRQALLTDLQGHLRPAPGTPVDIGAYEYGSRPATSPVYRFFNTIAGGHFFTISEEEKNTVIQNYPWFRFEQTGFHAYPVQQPGTLPVYRFFNTIAGGHFFTISEAEKDTVIQNYPWFRFEQTGFYAYAVPQPGSLPVYRFFNTIAGGHFFTISEEEKNTVIQNYPWFRFEQTGFHAYPSP